MSWTGTLERADFGPGGWVLRTKGGEQIALQGEVPKNLEGKAVRVTGKAVEAHGFLMVGSKTVAVERVEPR